MAAWERGQLRRLQGWQADLCFLDDGDANIAGLRDLIAKEFDAGIDQLGAYMNKLRAQRARKVLADIEAWKAEVQSRTDAAGLTQAREIKARGKIVEKEHAAGISAIEPTTFRKLCREDGFPSWDSHST